jgi:predicted RNase H-like HicB family nuclease
MARAQLGFFVPAGHDPVPRHYAGAPMTNLTAYVEQDPETQLYVGVVPGLPGAHTQAASLDELRANLEEVIGLLLEEDAGLRDRLADITPAGRYHIGLLSMLSPHS